MARKSASCGVLLLFLSLPPTVNTANAAPSSRSVSPADALQTLSRQRLVLQRVADAAGASRRAEHRSEVEIDRLIAALEGALHLGRPCDQRFPWRELAGHFETLDLLLAERATFPRSVPADKRLAWADWSEADSEALDAAIERQQLTFLREDLKEVHSYLTRLCGDRRVAEHEGTIVSYNAGRATVVLDGERTFPLVLGTEVSGQVFPGRRVRLKVATLGSGPVYVEEIAEVGTHPASKLKGTVTPGCLSFKVAPLQPFWPEFQGPYLLHAADGYRVFPPGSTPNHAGTLAIENGMRLAVRDEGCTTAGGDQDGQFESFRYSVALALTYEADGVPGVTIDKQVLSADLKDGADPVKLPGNVSSDQVAKLYVTWHVQRCVSDGTPLPPSCGAKETIQEARYDLIVRPPGTYCAALFADTTFKLESAGPKEIRITQVTGTETPWLDAHIKTKTFHADSETGPIGLNADFAVYRKHIYSGDFGLPGPNESLRNARVEGKAKTGGGYRYTCSLPALVGDVLHRCSDDKPDTYYKFPFTGPMPYWAMGQGNNGEFTHKGKTAYAFDFRQDEGTPIHAARSGRVTGVRKNVWWNCLLLPSMPCSANYVNISHQDGSEARYVHMPLNKVFVDEGDWVQRGQPLGEVGNTGKSTQPHLHFEVREAGSSIPVTFERFDTHDQSKVYFCSIPEKGESLRSTNAWP